jgi:hypothetical protein
MERRLYSALVEDVEGQLSEIIVKDGFCEIRRGEAEIPPNTPIAAYTSPLGNLIFEQHVD